MRALGIRARIRHNNAICGVRMDIMKLLTTKQVAEIITQRTGHSISVRQVQKEIKNGHIKGEKMGNTYLIKENALNHYERRHPGVQGKK